MQSLPNHLQKYVVEQNYERYTPVDQAVWRYILRQLRAFHAVNAHEAYVEGLEKTGIEVDEIPHIEKVSAALEKFGWRALPVSGFIPPAAFMELQSLGVLPIASDMRNLDNLLYTPAPDIVHEAAGHAPLLIHPELSDYLKEYAQVAKKALISKEDLELYEAIRDLSDTKENPLSNAADIQRAEENLVKVSNSISHISEAAELSRMNWWTVEYGLIGSLENPKIMGAGLLSSVGESKWCLSDKVRKLPLSVSCIETSYDITEPQPQLFVTPDFATLKTVLHEMADKMAFKIGGREGLEKAIQAESVNTAELNSGLQMSGVITEALYGPDNKPVYLKLNGPSQLSYQDHELSCHGKDYHAHGFGTPLGTLKSYPNRCPSSLSLEEFAKAGVSRGELCTLEYSSGLIVTGIVLDILYKDKKALILSLKDATAELQGRILFQPEWGVFDIALGSEVTSVFGGPADRISYGETVDFVAKKVPAPKYSDLEKEKHSNYGKVRALRKKGNGTEAELDTVISAHQKKFPQDWLLTLEGLEILHFLKTEQAEILRQKFKKHLDQLSLKDEKTKNLINDGLKLIGIV